MDKEGAILVLNWDESLDLDDHMLTILFNFKNKLNTSSFHPKLVDQRLEKLEKQLDAFYYLSGSNSGEILEPNNNIQWPSDKLEGFNQFEHLKATLKQQLFASNTPNRIVSLTISLKSLYLGWWEILLDSYSGDEVKENKELDQMAMLNYLTKWKATSYSKDVLQNDNFAPLKKELDRICKISESYV